MVEIVCRVSRLGVVLEEHSAAESRGLDRESPVGSSLAEWAGADPDAFADAIAHAIDDEGATALDWRSTEGAGYWHARLVCAGGDELLVVLRDVTREQCRTEADDFVRGIERRLAKVPGTAGDAELLESLKDLIAFLSAHGAAVVVFDSESNRMSRLVDVAPPAAKEAFASFDPSHPSWLSRNLSVFERPVIVAAADLPPDAVVMRRIAAAGAVTALGIIPIVHDGATIGIVGTGFADAPDRAGRFRHEALGRLGHALGPTVARRRREIFPPSRARAEPSLERHRDLIAVLDAQGNVRFASPTLAALAQWDEAHPPDRSSMQHVDAEDRGDLETAFTKALEQPGEPVSVSFVGHAPGGSVHQIVGTLTNLLDVAGVDGIVVNVRDVTDEHTAAAMLAQRRELDALTADISRALLSVPSEGIIDALQNALGRVARHIGADAATLGRREADGWFLRVCGWYEPAVGPVPRPAMDRVPPDAFPFVFAAVAAGRGGVVQDVAELPPDAIAERARMEQVGALSAALVSISGGGDLIAYMNFYWRTKRADDLTALLGPLRNLGDLLTAAYDRGQADLGRREVDERLQSVFDALGEAILVLDADGSVVTANRAAVRLFGRRYDELVGSRRWWSTMPVHEDGTPFEMTDLATVQTLRDGRPRDGVLSGVDTAFGRQWLSVNTRPIGEDGRPSGVVTSFTDVTARVESQVLKSRLAMIVESSHDAIMSTTLDGTIESWNSGAERIYGYTADEVLGRKAAILTPPDLEEARDEMIVRIARGDAVDEYQTVRVAKDGTRLDVAITVSATRDPDGRIIGASSITRDITEQKRAEADRRQADERFRSLIEQGSEGILVFDADGAITFASPAVEGIYGYTPEELVGQHGKDMIPTDSYPGAKEVYAKLLRNPGSFVKFSDHVLHRDGRQRWVEGTTTNLLHDESVGGFVVNVRDVSERKSFERELEHQALHDSLTGLPNRALLVDRLEQALARARRSPHEVGLLFLDLDRFKYVNDSRGHASGDELLRLVGRRLQGAVRASDTVARFGGDEFVVLIEESASTEGLLAAVETIRTALRAPFVLDGVETFVTASIGIASSNPEQEDPNLIRDADAAMYRAKDRGRDRYEMFDPSIHARAVEHLEITNSLRAALVEDQLALHYQPIVDLRTSALLGFEGLLRWHQPDGTVSLPETLIAVAEETGLIVPIGAWVIEEACRQIATWAGYGPSPATLIGINLSVRQLREPDLVREVERITTKHGVSPTSLTFEITESVLAEDTAATLAVLSGLRELGVSLVIDDFGTGYSSLAYLKQLPVTAVKIDRTFIDGLGDEPEDTAIVTAIVGLAKGLGLATVAEGVETQRQVDELLALGVDVGQGYLLGRPAPPDQWTDLIQANLEAE